MHLNYPALDKFALTGKRYFELASQYTNSEFDKRHLEGIQKDWLIATPSIFYILTCVVSSDKWKAPKVIPENWNKI